MPVGIDQSAGDKKSERRQTVTVGSNDERRQSRSALLHEQRTECERDCGDKHHGITRQR